ncbi:acetate/propionate family kinase [Treponema phagedenis]|uniref:acetate/propionate family kinase n=1 Tax=Treponema phagedenis TaxID=162 RepID=UPI0001F6393A|nr:acetate kinase [Treponema phagedenis]EFW36475.1 acetate kinase [Treponema phagedenis F0421]TYT79085.1 acetate kinase [Treponema phagedenis]
MKILVINCGSSSLKYQLIDMSNESILVKGLAERIGIDGSRLKHEKKGMDAVVIEKPMPDHTTAVKLVLDALVDKNHGVIQSMDEIAAVGHRVVHGGDKFKEPAIINDAVMKDIRACIPLGPLHNPANIMGIEACMKLMPNTPMVAVFDTAFHQTLSPENYMYAIPYKYYEKLKIRKYGFHGISHRFVSQRAIEMLGNKPNSKIITCHLGNGSSLAAVKDGKCIDTSMGLTPLEGLVMGTRSGDLDPAIIGFIMNEEKISADQVNNILNKEAGVLGISGVSSDFRDLDVAAAEGNERAQLALSMFVNQVRKYIGSYIVQLGGIDALVFTAGIGENAADIREKVCTGLDFLGLEIDPQKNNIRGKEAVVSKDSSPKKVFVIPTNEELMIAKDTMLLVK